MGSIRYPQLNKITSQIWNWCDALNKRAFQQIVNLFGQPEIDLFASNINSKCSNYISWGPDPDSEAVDAFTIGWNNFYFCAFPPFCIIDRVLAKITSDEANGILVVPNWPSQAWFPLFKSLLTEEPIVFQPFSNLLLSPFREPHPLHKTLSLVAGNLSGKRYNRNAYPNQTYPL